MRVFALADLHLSFSAAKPMTVFGPGWAGHPQAIFERWPQVVRDEDLVLLPGDLSWAMKLQEALGDLERVAALPGTKVLLRGNHDYWWPAIGRLRAALPAGMLALQNDAVRVGDVVAVLDETTNKRYDAKVYAIDPQIDPVSRTQPVRARYANANDELRPGAFVKVNLQLGESTAALQVPTEAVVPEASGYSVYTVKGGKMVPKKVKIGIRSDKVIQITDGLAVGDSVIQTGILQVKPGDAVKATK